MTAFVLILAALHLGTPVRCYESGLAWNVAAGPIAHTAAAFYSPDELGAPFIALGPRACRQVRSATYQGAFILGHELTHRWQDVTGRPFSEDEADRLGWLHADLWVRRLARVFGVSVGPKIVRLAHG